MDTASNELTGTIIDGIIKVHQTLGPGFLESVYQHALILELRKRGLNVELENEINVLYDGQIVGRHRLDLVVDQEVIVEVKTVERLGKAHYAQVRSYLKATGLKTAILVNFAAEKADFRRIDHA